MAEAGKAKTQDNLSKNKKQNKGANPNHVFRKRQVSKPETGANVIYVSTKSALKGLFEQCSKLINNNHNELIIYCLGASIQRGILLALQLCDKFVSFQHETKTFSTTLIDDLEPAIDDADYEVQKRFNSALRIRVFRSDLMDQPSSSGENLK